MEGRQDEEIEFISQTEDNWKVCLYFKDRADVYSDF